MNADDIKNWIGRTRGYLGGSIGKTVSDATAQISTKIWPQVWQAVMAPKPDATLDAAIAEKAAASAPVVWLIGKVQSGILSLSVLCSRRRIMSSNSHCLSRFNRSIECKRRQNRE